MGIISLFGLSTFTSVAKNASKISFSRTTMIYILSKTSCLPTDEQKMRNKLIRSTIGRLVITEFGGDEGTHPYPNTFVLSFNFRCQMLHYTLWRHELIFVIKHRPKHSVNSHSVCHLAFAWAQRTNLNQVSWIGSFVCRFRLCVFLHRAHNGRAVRTFSLRRCASIFWYLILVLNASHGSSKLWPTNHQRIH